MEAVGEAAKAAIPNYAEALDSARANRDQLQRERKASRPVRWRLVEAQGSAKSKADHLDKAHKKMDALQAQHDELQGKVAEQKLEIARANQALLEADSAVAKILEEIADESRAVADTQPVRTTQQVMGAVEGLAMQVQALPSAMAARNAEAAISAIQQQIAALLSSLRPVEDDGDDESSEAGCRSRGREELTPAEQEATSKSRRLEDLGFSVTTGSDPYSAVEVASATPSRG